MLRMNSNHLVCFFQKGIPHDQKLDHMVTWPCHMHTTWYNIYVQSVFKETWLYIHVFSGTIIYNSIKLNIKYAFHIYLNCFPDWINYFNIEINNILQYI